MRLLIPPLERKPWPTIGPEVCDWIEAMQVHGPGDLLGERVDLTDEERLFLYRAYEVYPRGHRLEGRRRFKRVVYSRRKGAGKTALAQFVAIAEMDPGAPVRCDGFKKDSRVWVPVGRPVRDPYIPMVAYTEEQTTDLAYAGVKAILEHPACPLTDDYVVGVDRITHRTSAGKLQPLASAPNARDGARTSFQHFDETHRFTSDKLRDAHATMLRNIPKRPVADAWSLETTTMYEPGMGSVAEHSHAYAETVQTGEISDPRLFFDHRQADAKWDLEDPDQLREAIVEASGDALTYTDIEAVLATWQDPQEDPADFRRFWLNQRWVGSGKWIKRLIWDERIQLRDVADGESVTLGFSGNYSATQAAVIACTLDGYVWPLQIWNDGGLVRRDDVDQVVSDAWETFEVVELACNPARWIDLIEEWEERWEDSVVRHDARSPRRFTQACGRFFQAVETGEGLTHSGDDALAGELVLVEVRKHYGDPYITGQQAPIAAVIAYDRAMSHTEKEELVPMAYWL